MNSPRPAFVGTVVVAVASVGVGCHSTPSEKTAASSRVAGPADADAYRASVEAPPAGWQGPRFTLSHDYPAQKPAPPAGGRYPWERVDFAKEPRRYIAAILGYARNGLEAANWDAASQTPPRFFHAPWMSSGTEDGTGRECFHGMTRERTVSQSELVRGGSTALKYKNYAVGYYNDVGAWTFGRTFADAAHPDLGAARFENGAMSFKLLFTTAPVAEVPSLAGSLEWDCDVFDAAAGKRMPVKVHLLQVDVAVRDQRNALTGWVFGTFAYDAAAPGASPIDRLEPVGLVWGDDPGVSPAAGSLQQCWINPAIGTYQHLGWAGRLNGPVDNPKSSCLSCHSKAQEPAAVAMLPPPTATVAEALTWFTNVRAGEAFSPGSRSLDYSLQLGVGVVQAGKWVAAHAAVPVLGASPAGEHPFTRGE